MVAAQRSALTTTLPSDREIEMTREFDAPRELVFKAFTDPELIPRWWGQRNSTTIVDKLDLRPGGLWRFVQRTPDGTEHAFNGEFREIVPPVRLAYTFEYESMAGHIVIDTVDFEEIDGKTKVITRSLFQSVEDRDGMLNSGMEAGAAESYDRLAELLVTS
jgi:uncharacterized protein YndB with AHSA1/START domain